MLIVDEGYYEFINETVADMTEKYPQLVVLRTFSKAFGLPGLRVGYGMARADTVAEINRLIPIMPVTSIAEVAVKAALADLPHVRRAVQWIGAERARVQNGLKEMGFEPVTSHADFMIVRIPEAFPSAASFIAALNKYDLNVADGAKIEGVGERYIRLCLRTEDVNQEFLKITQKLMVLSKKTRLLQEIPKALE